MTAQASTWWQRPWQRGARLALWLGVAGVLGLASQGAQALPPQLFKPEWVLPTAPVSGPKAGQAPTREALPSAPRDLSSVRYEWEGRQWSLEDFQSRGSVKALLVLQDGKVVYEHHRWPNGPATLHQSWSMMKQVLSALVGLAIQQGRIASVDDPMDRYAPALAANGFKGVTFKQALMMSAGVRYVEEVDRVALFSRSSPTGSRAAWRATRLTRR